MLRKKIHLALLMMVKNEEKRIHVSLNSIKDYVDSIIIYDTGSTDNTLQIISDFANKNNLKYRLKQGNFVDFSTSRNVALDFVDTFEEVDFVLLLDSNDELKGGKHLRKVLNQEITSKNTAYFVCQEWLNTTLDKYYNIRLIKPRRGWRYKGSVHEYFNNSDSEPDKDVIFRLDDNIILFQDRKQDVEKSKDRFKRDKELLIRDHKQDLNEPRTLFYLAQTCSCLGQLEDSYYYYKLRTITPQKGFWEEIFNAYLRLGDLSLQLGHEWHDVIIWYLRAFEFCKRVEPLIRLAKYYISKNDFEPAYMYLHMACQLNYPNDCILFVERLAYDYERWHLMGIVGFYVKQYKEGMDACLKAIKVGGLEVDKCNLKFYGKYNKGSSKVKKRKKK